MNPNVATSWATYTFAGQCSDERTTADGTNNSRFGRKKGENYSLGWPRNSTLAYGIIGRTRGGELHRPYGVAFSRKWNLPTFGRKTRERRRLFCFLLFFYPRGMTTKLITTGLNLCWIVKEIEFERCVVLNRTCTSRNDDGHVVGRPHVVNHVLQSANFALALSWKKNILIMC